MSGGSNIGTCTVTGTTSLTLTLASGAITTCPITLTANVTSVTVTGAQSGFNQMTLYITNGAGPYTMAAPSGFNNWTNPLQGNGAITDLVYQTSNGGSAWQLANSSNQSFGERQSASAPTTPVSGDGRDWFDTTDLDAEWKNSAGSVFKAFLSGADANPVTGQINNLSHVTNGSILNSGLANTGITVNGQTLYAQLRIVMHCTVTPGVTITTGTTATLSTAFTINQEATAATAVAYTLPTASAGAQFCVDNGYNGSAADTGALTVNASASGQFIIFTDGTLSATGGNVVSGGAARDGACFAGIDSTHWMFYPHSQSGAAWTKH